jgi:hypothetical protein
MNNIIEEIYVVVNLIANKRELIYFVPNYDIHKTLIQKKNITELKKIYKNYQVLSELNNDSKIINLNVSCLTVSEFKLHLFNLIKELPEHLYLFGTLGKISVKKINELRNRKEVFNENIYKDITIGFSYQNEFGSR